MNLEALRKKIDDLDERLVQLLNDRIKVALEIGELKNLESAEIYVPAREKAVLGRVTALNKGPLKDRSLQAIYREVMSASIALERRVKIAYLGPPATFTHQAARSRFGGSVEYEPCETISGVFDSVEHKTADYGVVPIENSTEGAVTHTLDRLTDTSARICAEIFLPISHHLMAICSQKEIKRVYSNPQVFGQCRSWLLEHASGVEQIPISSTAKAAERAVSETGSGAIASALAAELYGLNLLQRDIQDLKGNTTRFFVLAKNYGAPTGKDKTSIVLGIRHKTGALHEALGVFREAELNMTKIESRPSKSKAWEYYFFVDIEGHADDVSVKRALEALSDHCMILTVLGAYPRSACPA